MRVFALDSISDQQRRTLALRGVIVLVVAWIALGFGSAGADRGDARTTDRAPAASPIVLTQTSTAPLPLDRPPDGAPAHAAGSFRIALVAPSHSLLHDVTAKRRFPPTFFERVSYRTTGPPHRIG